jgi:hypothetical protein
MVIQGVAMSSRERQVGGDHYKQKAIQPWDIITEYHLDFFEGNVLKYLLRRKGDRLEDLKKAQHYLERKIELEEANG